MKAVIQRVSHAKVEINQETVGEISHGFLVLLGIVEDDCDEDIDWLVGKITKMRVFADEEGKMNRSLLDVDGGLLVVSQFTLHASTKKGNRPSFIKAARPDTAIPLYQNFLTKSEITIRKPCASGEFGADMQVCLTNDGPVTIVIDSKARE